MQTETHTPETRHVGKMTIRRLSDREAEIRRRFDAPRSLVFEALSKPEHVARWWGPRGTTLTVTEMDFRPGGRWRFVVTKDGGEEYAFRGEYRDIEPPERIVQTFEFEGMPGAISVERLTLTEEDGTTTLAVRTSFDSLEALEGMLASGMEAGAAETYDRLEEHLRTLA